MNYEKLKGGLIAAFAGTGLIVSLGLGSGIVANAEDIADDTAQGADTNSTVLTEEQCTWFMVGAPSAINMVPGVETDGETPIEYTGEDLSISASLDEISVYSSGNLGTGTKDATTECSFYTPVTSPVITWSAQDPSFTATYLSGGVPTNDTGLDFELSESKPLTVDLEEKVAGTTAINCDDSFEVNDLNLYALSLTGVGLTIPTVSDVTSPVATGEGDLCTTKLSIATTIPGGENLKPEAPGVDYTWTGPTLQIVRSTSEVDKTSR